MKIKKTTSSPGDTFDWSVEAQFPFTLRQNLKRDPLLILARDALNRNVLHHVPDLDSEVLRFDVLLAVIPYVPDLLKQKDLAGNLPLHLLLKAAKDEKLAVLISFYLKPILSDREELYFQLTEKDPDGYTALHLLVRHGGLLALQHMRLATNGFRGVGLNHLSDEGYSAFDYAVLKNKLEMADYLLDSGVKLNRTLAEYMALIWQSIKNRNHGKALYSRIQCYFANKPVADVNFYGKSRLLSQKLPRNSQADEVYFADSSDQEEPDQRNPASLRP